MIIYIDEIPQGEAALLDGKLPKEIHFYFKRYDIEDIPEKDEQLERWIIDRFREKEEFLKEYYNGSRTFPDPIEYPNDGIAKLKMILALFMWTLFSFVSIYLMFAYSIIRWYFLGISLFFAIVTWFGGTDKLEIWYHRTKYSQSDSN
jgi:lysocardiolipin and lysophospholipid acyltransferase